MVASTRAEEPNRAIEDGRVALARGAWAEARVRFADALAQEETPEALEGMGLAARYEPTGSIGSSQFEIGVMPWRPATGSCPPATVSIASWRPSEHAAELQEALVRRRVEVLVDEPAEARRQLPPCRRFELPACGRVQTDAFARLGMRRTATLRRR
jgi:hypothetical protein